MKFVDSGSAVQKCDGAEGEEERKHRKPYIIGMHDRDLVADLFLYSALVLMFLPIRRSEANCDGRSAPHVAAVSHPRSPYVLLRLCRPPAPTALQRRSNRCRSHCESTLGDSSSQEERKRACAPVHPFETLILSLC